MTASILGHSLTPKGWKAIGEWVHVYPKTATEQELSMLTQDIIQYRSPMGEWTVDIGFGPEECRGGNFVCQVVSRNDWEHPEQYHETPCPEEAFVWLGDQLKKLG